MKNDLIKNKYDFSKVLKSLPALSPEQFIGLSSIKKDEFYIAVMDFVKNCKKGGKQVITAIPDLLSQIDKLYGSDGIVTDIVDNAIKEIYSKLDDAGKRSFNSTECVVSLIVEIIGKVQKDLGE